MSKHNRRALMVAHAMMNCALEDTDDPELQFILRSSLDHLERHPIVRNCLERMAKTGQTNGFEEEEED